MQQQKDKIRMFALARELGMESKDLLSLCQDHGLDIKNQLSTVEPEVREQIMKIVGGPAKGAKAPPAPPPPPPQANPVLPKPMKTLVTPPKKPTPPAPPPAPAPVAPVVAAPAPAPAPPAPAPVAQAPAPAPKPPAPAPAPVVAHAVAAPPAPVPEAKAVVVEKPVAPPPAPVVPPPAPAVAPVAQQPPAPVAPPPVAPAPRPPQPSASGQRPMTNLTGQRPMRNIAPPRPQPPAQPPAQPPRPQQPAAGNPPPRPQQPQPGGYQGQGGGGRPAPGGFQGQGGGSRPPMTPTPRGVIPPGGPRTGPGINRPGFSSGGSGSGNRGAVSPPPKPAAPVGNQPRKISDISPELQALLQGRDVSTISVKEVEEKMRQQAAGRSITPAAPGVPGVVVPDIGDGEGDDDKKGRAGGVPGRADRHKDRAERQAKRKEGDSRGGRIGVDDDENQRHRKRRPHEKIKRKGTEARKGRIPVSLPITVRSLSEAMGRKSNDLLAKLMSLGMLLTINSAIEPETAELLALDFGCELDIKLGADAERDLEQREEVKDAEESLVPRAPVVVIMGHVDHGKTSILDKIKGDNIVDTEAGGITQVLRAWRIDHDGKPITFLDTPGHEAFTKMRARGANVTDIAVIVVAANDGVMPQTEEAIAHAKAAEVQLIVAINKVDLPDANLRKTEQQLYSLGLVPDNMGGDVPFVKCSAKTGAGIDELLTQISVAAELLDLKANPDKVASGTVLEAYLSEKEGVQATLLVQGGTLREGDVVVAGHAFGTVRRMFNDRGKPIEEAGPSMPVRIIGLDEVPNADDAFNIVDDITTAREIAEQRKARIQEKAVASRVPVTLESLKATKVTELKVILKAEARGSIEAIRAELEKLKHDEVRVRLLHAAIGGISASDVQLALTSPEDTLILGFNVVPDNEASAMAEARGVEIREYDIIYRLVEDIRAALEGKLKPREDVIHLGRANVREVFKIGKVGTIAGCIVTQGTIERSALVRVIRSGLVIYPPAERTAKFESLRRFKEDAKEVREGFECGIKLANYDDIKVGDTIEAYRVEQVLRKLD